MKQINLYQAEFRPPTPVLPASQIVLVALVLCLALVGWAAWDNVRLRQAQAEVAALDARVQAAQRQADAALKPQRPADPQVVAETASVETKVQALDQAQAAIKAGALGSAAGYSGQFRAFAQATVPGIWLTRIDIADQGRAVDLAGRALSGEHHARLLTALRRQPLFAGLNYASLGVHPGQGKEVGKQVGEGKASEAPRFLEFALSTHLATAGAKP